MSLVHVQKWMAHMSPEMTLVYAKVLDTTLRKSWEQAVKNGLFKITSSGQLKQIDISGIENEDLIEWEYIRYNLDAVRMHEAQKAGLFYAAEPMPYLPQSLYYAGFSAAI